MIWEDTNWRNAIDTNIWEKTGIQSNQHDYIAAVSPDYKEDSLNNVIKDAAYVTRLIRQDETTQRIEMAILILKLFIAFFKLIFPNNDQKALKYGKQYTTKYNAGLLHA